MSHRAAEWLYVVNASLLLTHEIDSAYWHEWELLRIPGGIQVFLVLNLVLVLAVLWGLRELVLRHRGGLRMSLGLAGAGALAILIHGTFLVRGDPKFRLPASLVVLGSILVASIAQGVVTWRLLRGPGAGGR